MNGREPTRVYDPEHDAIWTAIRRLTWTVVALGLAVIALALGILL